MDGTLYKLWAAGPEYAVIVGSFAPNGGSAVDQTSIRGAGIKSVTWTATGTFDIVLKNAFLELECAIFTVQRSAAADGDVKVIGSEDVVTAKKITITHMAAGVAADVAANAANRIHFVLVLRNSKVLA